MRTCKGCSKEFSRYFEIECKMIDSGSRKYCLECSPFRRQNTKQFQDKFKEICCDVINGKKICPICKVLLDYNKDNYYMSSKHKGTNICKKCQNKSANKRNRDRKQAAVDYKGGKCIECGYNKCLTALEFHHLDPSQKDFELSDKREFNIEKIKEELDKCILLCSNCHREKHWIERHGSLSQIDQNN